MSKTELLQEAIAQLQQLPIPEQNAIAQHLLDELEERLAIRNYDEAKQSQDEVISFEQAIHETEYLLASEANRDRLLKAIKNVENREKCVEVSWEECGVQ